MELKRFDLLLVKGDSLISHEIEDITDSPYSHVAIVLDEYHVAETDWRFPLVVHHISKYPNDMYDVYSFYRAFTEEETQRMDAFLMRKWGTRYDYLETITNGLHILFGWGIYNAPNRMNCVDSAVDLFGAASIPLESDGTPGGLSKSSFLTRRF